MSENKDDRFIRVYHSQERVLFVGRQPCVCGCGEGNSVNAHTKSGGTGRKAGYKTIVPLSYWCHVDAHQIGMETFRERRNIEKTWAELARETEAKWIEHTEGME